MVEGYPCCPCDPTRVCRPCGSCHPILPTWLLHGATASLQTKTKKIEQPMAKPSPRRKRKKLCAISMAPDAMILLWAALVSSCACSVGAETPRFHRHPQPWGQKSKLWRESASASMGALRLVGADRISIRGGGLAEDVAGMEIQKGGGDDEWAKMLEAKLKMVNVSPGSSCSCTSAPRGCLSLPLGTSSSSLASALALSS